MKIVFDSNVYLGATKLNSYSYRLVLGSKPGGRYQVYVSPEILIEVKEKLLLKFGYTTEQAARFLNLIQSYAIIVNPSRKVTNILSDKDDHIVLECALEAQAHVIISADRGLLRLKEFENIKIAHPSMLKYWFKPVVSD